MSSRKMAKSSLRILQPSATDKTILVGRQKEKTGIKLKKYNKVAHASKSKDLRKYLGKENDFCDGSVTSEDIHTEKQDESQWLVNPDPDVGYWKQLAEERRLALEAALKENENLRDQIEVLEVENTQLKEMNEEAEQVLKLVKENILEEENPDEVLERNSAAERRPNS